MPTAAAAAAASSALLRCGLHFPCWRRHLLLLPVAVGKTKTPSSVSSGAGALLLRSRVTSAASFCTASPDATSAAVEVAPSGTGGNRNAEAAIDVKQIANTLDIRVGRILKAWRHEEADSLYVEEVDIGEADPRIICSGLVNYIPLDLLQVIHTYPPPTQTSRFSPLSEKREQMRRIRVRALVMTQFRCSWTVCVQIA